MPAHTQRIATAAALSTAAAAAVVDPAVDKGNLFMQDIVLN